MHRRRLLSASTAATHWLAGQGNLGVPCQSCALVEPAGAGLVQAGPIPGLRPAASRSLASPDPVTVPSTGPSAISGPEPMIPDEPQDR
jgi:hypothetical protein